MNRIRLSVAAMAAATMTLAACGGETASTGSTADTDATAADAAADCVEKELKFSFIASNTSTWQQAADKFGEEVEANTDGRVTVKTFAGGQLANANQQTELQLAQQGVIDVQWISPIILALYLDKRFDVYSLPFLFPDHDVANTVIDGPMGEESEEWLRAKGLEPLGWGVNGFRQLTNSERPVTSPEDVEGLNVRVAGTKLFQEIFSSMDAEPVTMSFGEVYTALEQGAIDGQENPLSIINSSSLYSVQDHLSMWNYSYDPLVMIMNDVSFSELCEQDQQAVQEAGDVAGDLQRDLTKQEDVDLPAELAEKGLEVVATEDVDVDAFREVTEPIYDQFRPIIGEDVVEMMLSEVEKAEQQ